ncbi:ATP-binding cassette domain-containing protein [Pontiella sp.]|uniref:ABC transporter ATP-binding protein n=1 Tax=Pontiella sp. TaxID=2837462 RepID=UPI00356A2ABB
MIVFKNITLHVHRQTLLDGADLSIALGEKAVVRGPSGCGKSSLLKSAVGILPLASGSIAVDGQELSAETIGGIRGRIAFIGQEPVLGADTVREALLLPFSFKTHRGNRPPDDRVLEALHDLHLGEEILDKPSKRISGGEKQRIALARALLLGKDIFLADEVTSALDPESKAAVMERLFRPGITLLSVSHDPDWIAKCNRVIGIENHRLTEESA